MRIVFMGTPDFALPTLQALAESEHELAAVYTRPDQPVGRGQRLTPSPVKRFALERDLPLRQPPGLRDVAEVAALRELGPDLIVDAAYGVLLRPSVLAIPRYGCLNIHPSLLPRHRGPSPIVSAILAGDAETGITLMLMDAGVDTGPILAQVTLPIGPDDTAGSLSPRLAELAAQLLMVNLSAWFEGHLRPRPQDEALATHTRLVAKTDGEIDWSLATIDICRRIRAYDPWPGAYTSFDGKSLKLLGAVPLPEAESPGVGTVVRLERGGPAEIGVGTGAGVLGLLRLQLEGSRPMAAAEFARGRRNFIGAALGGAMRPRNS